MMRIVLLYMLCLLSIPSASAQTKRELLRERVDSVLLAKYNKVNYDTNYIKRPQTRLTLKFRTNVSGYGIHTDGTVDGIDSKANLHTKYRTTLSFGASYRGLSAGLSINPASLEGLDNDIELKVNFYTNRFAINASYQNAKTLTGEIEHGMKFRLEKEHVTMQVFNVTGYYIFNYRRFSFPAAFTQSYIQRRSVGSWLGGFSYQAGRIKTADDIPDYIPEARIYVGHLGIGAGYAYNFVVRDKWLFHISALPTFVIYNRSNITLKGVRRTIETKFPDMIFNEHVAIVRNFSLRYFAGASLIVGNTLYNDNDVVINQNKWHAHLFFGMRL